MVRLGRLLLAFCTALFSFGVFALPVLAQASTADIACSVTRPCPPPPPQYFFQTGFQVGTPQFWNYFLRRGGVTTFGYPISRTFQLLGYPTQIFQRQVMQLWPDGSVHLLNLLDPSVMPYTSFNFSQIPAVDPPLIAQAPSPNDPNYAREVIAFVEQHAPNQWNGLPVDFAQTFGVSVLASVAFPGLPASSSQVQALLPLVQLEVWGIPVSEPAYDPANHSFVYLRWQRGVMMYDASCGCTEGMLFGQYLKEIMMDQNLPPDLQQEAAGSPYLAQYDPSQPDWIAHPAELPETNLISAFVPVPQPLLFPKTGQ
ncbi:MAG: hypothetical protein M1118_02910 [Chloroflexi bacterium]|nr:hypothetical protein [Chloroflexota bacterium]